MGESTAAARAGGVHVLKGRVTLRRLAVGSFAIVAGLYGLFWLVVLVLALLVPRQTTKNIAVSGQCDRRSWPNALALFTWNIGYAGTGAEADLFMDGGRDVLAKDKKTVQDHLHNIIEVLHGHPSDIYLLQEVDSGSRRTYRVDEEGSIKAGLQNYCSSYGLNHNVPFLPYPYTKPLGRVRSGLLSLATYKPQRAIRYQLPGSFPWPESAFQLQRCLLIWRLPRDDGREWIVINAHLEAWDKGEIRKQELTSLRDLAQQEYLKGNFVVIGGDWNSVLPGVRLDQFPSKDKPGAHTMKLPEDFFPKDWRWGIDRTHPSSRRCNTPYHRGQNYVTIIDGFLVSPNVSIDSVAAVQRCFKDSDHEPLEIRVHGL